MLNPKQRETYSLNGKVGYLCVTHLFMCKGYLCVTLHMVIPNAMKKASSVWNDYQTHMSVRN